MKVHFLFIGFAFFILSTLKTNGQDRQPQAKPAWHVSKDVQKIANKKLFKSEPLRKSHIEAVSSGPPSHVLSKGVNNIHRPVAKRAGVAGNIKSKGYPVWTISKGVHRFRSR